MAAASPSVRPVVPAVVGRRDARDLGRLPRGQPDGRAVARPARRPRPGLPRAGLPPVARPRVPATAATQRADRALHAHALRGAVVPRGAPLIDPRGAAARDARRRRARLPGRTLGRELPAVRARHAPRCARRRPSAPDPDRRPNGARPNLSGVAGPGTAARDLPKQGGHEDPQGPRRVERGREAARARRPTRAVEEHRARVPGVRNVPARPARLARQGAVPRAPAALAYRDPRVPGVRGSACARWSR